MKLKIISLCLILMPLCAQEGTIQAMNTWFSADTSMPTLEQLNVVTFTPIQDAGLETVATNPDQVISTLKAKSGIIRVKEDLYRIQAGIPDTIKEQNRPITIYSGGYSNHGRPYGFCVYRAMQAGIIRGPCVVFNYATDTRRAFNFCQEQDLKCVDLVYQDLIEKHPEAQIILYGACKGATNKLRFLAEKAEQNKSLENIKAIIVESPALSPKLALQYWKNGGPISHWLCRLVLPNYRPDKLKTLFDANAFPTNIPVLLGSLPDDTISALPDITRMKSHLILLDADIQHFICTGKDVEIRHGRIYQSEQWQHAVNEFLIKNSLRQQSSEKVEKES